MTRLLRHYRIGGLWLILVIVIAAAMGSLNGPRFLPLARRGVSHTAAITSTDCANHNLVRYRFEYEGKTYSGSGTASVPCETLKPGDPVSITLDPENPDKNIAGSGKGAFFGELISVTCVGLFGATLATAIYVFKRNASSRN